jgi:hypothetical protein
MKLKEFSLKLFILIFIIFCFSKCEKEPLVPFNIFETETLGSDTTSLNLSGLEGAPAIIVNGDRIMETDSGYHIKGTLFSESVSGIIPITCGDVEIVNNENGNTKSFSGYGTALFPEVGLFKYIENEFKNGGYFDYLTGKEFKAEEGKEDLPLLDEKYYFGFELDDSEDGESPSVQIKNTKITFNDYYVDTYDPAFIVEGELEYENAVKGKSFKIENLGIGISANGLFPFTPYKFSDRMEEVSGGTGFEEFSGHVFLKGELPLEKYNMRVYGEAVINNTFNENGILDFFDNGFEDGKFMMGMNGTLFFDHDLLEYLPMDLEIELGRATLQTKVSGDETYLRMAGEYKQANLIEEILGSDIMKYIPYTGREGRMYVSMGEEKDDWLFYFETDMSMNIPGMGVTSLQQAIIKVTPDNVEIFAGVQIPYDVGSVSFTGEIFSNGNFTMQGMAECDLNFGGGIRFNSLLDITCSNSGLSIIGSSSLPYSIGDVDIKGSITSECLSMSGMINSQVDFGNGVSLPAVNLELSASSCTGVSMTGNLNFPYDIALVQVEGKLTSSELAFKGLINSHINFGSINMPAVNMAVSASTLNGISFAGQLDVPYNILLVEVTGSLKPEGIRFSGGFGSNIDFGGGFKLPSANMTLSASSVFSEGISFSGELNVPGGIGNVSGFGRISSSAISFGGSLSGGLDIAGVPLLSNSLDVSISTNFGVVMALIYGNINFPCGFGNINCSGSFNSNGSFQMHGSKGYGFDAGLSGDVEISADVSSSDVSFGAHAEACVGEICVGTGGDVNVDWGNRDFELCLDFGVLGDLCLDSGALF